ncbi:DUF4158 domain-containing protein [Nocardia sp. CY41]|uniref:DUF4158 domain-containing protein n=1 Tax=Nocardia sp. CY41 TaxID=2608686 RepID=UPI001F299A61|nr:DUF4158 domain-containing protein [Nocardia sp. CY41]
MTDEGGYGRFGALSRVELERFFYLDDEDRKLVAGRRRDYNRLGFALQVVTVRQLGMFLADPLDVPPELVDYLAEQLGIEDSSCVKRYTEREKTKLEHAWEIQREYGLTSYGEVESELAAWVADQAWVMGDGPNAMFAGAVDWLRKRQALLPGLRTLERLVTEGRQAADRRLCGQLTGQLSAGSASALLALLAGARGQAPCQRTGTASPGRVPDQFQRDAGGIGPPRRAYRGGRTVPGCVAGSPAPSDRTGHLRIVEQGSPRCAASSPASIGWR